jgi:hypothetical protein
MSAPTGQCKQSRKQEKVFFMLYNQPETGVNKTFAIAAINL